ncbi:MAG TPA: methyltransferase domain-containing protein [Mucilaginibacter sp.]|nr:methyltransferase domain-containing protein [Mucilaginibacter sp.]
MEKKEAYTFTNEDAENYDRYIGPILFEPYGQFMASKVKADGISSVLEVACGSGRLTRHLREVLPTNIRLFATDISPDMLAIAQRELNNNGISFQTENLLNLSFSDNSFDLVICQFGMMFLPDKQKGFDELYRVLKPGGKLMVFTWDDTLNMPLFKLLIDELILPHFRDEDTTRFKVPFSLHDEKILINWMKNSGFKDTETSKISLPSGPSTAELVVTGLFTKHPLGKEMMNKDANAFEPVALKFAEEVAKQFGAKNTSFPLSALLTTAIK